MSSGKYCNCYYLALTHTLKYNNTNLETIWSLSVGVTPGCCPTLLGCRLRRIWSRAWGGQMCYTSFHYWDAMSDIKKYDHWSNKILLNKKNSKPFNNFLPAVILYYIFHLSCNREKVKALPYFGTAHSSPGLPASLQRKSWSPAGGSASPVKHCKVQSSKDTPH